MRKERGGDNGRERRGERLRREGMWGREWKSKKEGQRGGGG